MNRLGVGFALHANREYLELVRPILEGEADYFEVNPETLWREEAGRLVRNDFHALFQEIRAQSGKPSVAHGLAFSLGTPLGDGEESRRTAAWLERLRDDHAVFGFDWLSEHLGWTTADALHAVLPLPLPYTEAARDTVVARLELLAQVVPEVAFENSANYFAFGGPGKEASFLNAILQRAPVSLLLDLHNVFTEARNQDFDPFAFVDQLDLSRVIQIHLSGGSESEADWLPSGRVLRLDSHDGPVPEEVWALLEHVLPRCTGLRGILLERLHGTFGPDEVPELLAEVQRARRLLERTPPGLPSPCRESPVSHGLPPGDSLEYLQRLVLTAVTSADSARALLQGKSGAPPPLADLLDRIDPEGVTLSGFIVRKLRFERLCSGDASIASWFERDPEGFVDAFDAYNRQVPPGAYFPQAEAAAFDAWRRGQG